MRHFLVNDRRAFSLIELIVVMAITGLLATLVLTAVQSAREASRRTACEANLHQIGVALAGYESAHAHFAPGSDDRGYSFLVSILSYSEQGALERELRESIVLTPFAQPGRFQGVGLYLCPSDPVAQMSIGGETEQHSATNYHGSFGSGVLKYGYNGVFQHKVLGGDVTPGMIVDGLSNTAAVSEGLVASGEHDVLRGLWHVNPGYGDLDEFAAACLDPALRTPDNPWQKGRPWFVGDAAITLYNHVLTPNLPWCLNGTGVQIGAYPPSSNHPPRFPLAGPWATIISRPSYTLTKTTMSPRDSKSLLARAAAKRKAARSKLMAVMLPSAPRTLAARFSDLWGGGNERLGVACSSRHLRRGVHGGLQR